MEASAIFTLAAMRGVRAGCLLTVSDAIGPDKKERIEDSVLKGAVDGMVGLALDTLKALH
jgi:purine-nucleoside phosphorylase